MVIYICKYTPVELLQALGRSAASPGEEVEDFASADAYLHSSVCAHARQLFTTLLEGQKPGCEVCEGRKDIVLTTCCDSIRRVADTLPKSVYETLTMLDLPHRADSAAANFYEKELERLIEVLKPKNGQPEELEVAAEMREAEKTGKMLSKRQREEFLEAWEKASDGRDTFAEKYPEGYLAVLGARVGGRLLAQLESRLPLPVDCTCGGQRHLPKMPEGAERLSDRDLLTAYAKALLSQTPCMRMENIAGRERLLKNPRLRGIIYHTVRFCDYYAFEYAALQKKVMLPMLKLESDFTAQSEGQLATRISAFAENLKLNAQKNGGGNSEEASQSRRAEGSPMAYYKSVSVTAVSSQKDRGETDENCVFIGIDSGSTTTNAAALGSDGRLLASCVLRTGPRAADAAANALTHVRTSLPAGTHIARVFATGYGRDYIAFADGTRTEISCHGRGAYYLYANARSVIDIGGQDSKVICLGEAGAVTNFVMNDKCAAGTGRFLEMMAATLEMKLSELSRRGRTWKKELTISSICTVFAESEVVSLIAQNNDTDDIVHALNKAVASKTVSMVRRVRGEGPYAMTGGVARNEGLVRELSRQLGATVHVPQNPDLAGAIGAALFAIEADR